MEVLVSVCGETPTVGEIFHCGDAYATVVSVDDQGGPVDVPFELKPTDAHDVKRCAHAAQRCGCRSLPSGWAGVPDLHAFAGMCFAA